MQEYENILNDFLSFCESKKYKIVGVDRLFEKEDYNSDGDILARVALYNHVPILIEVYNTDSIGLFFNLFECDPFSASLFTKEFLEREVDIISAFVEMKDQNGKLTHLLFGEDAVEQYAKEKQTKSEILSSLIN